MTKQSPPDVLARAKADLASITERLAGLRELYDARAELWARYVELGVTKADLARISGVTHGSVANAFRERGWDPVAQ
jgi:hypothetical protein